MRALAAIAMLGIMASCSSGTYALLTFEAKGGAPAPVKSLELQLTLDGKSADTTVTGKNGADITLPTSSSLQIRSGSGALDVIAMARGVGGVELGRGTGTGTVSNGTTAKIMVVIDFGATANTNDMASDGGATDMAQAPPMIGFDHQPQYDFGTNVTGASEPTRHVHRDEHRG